MPLLLMILAVGGGCTRHSQTAEERFKEALARYEDERPDEALALIPSEAELPALKASRDLRDRFRLLRADALVMGTNRNAGMALLAEPFEAGANPVYERQRRRSLGHGQCRGARAVEARAAGLAILDQVLAESPALSAEAGQVQLRRGACLFMMARVAASEAALLSGLESARAAHDGLLEAKILSSLGNVCASSGRFDEAAVYTGGARRAAERAGYAGRHVQRRALDNLGWLQYELGDYERAIDTLSKFQTTLDRERLVNENNQARTLLAMGDRAGAGVHFEKALAAARKGNVEASDEAAVLYGLAALAYRNGKWPEAARWYGDAMALAEKLRRPDMIRAGTLTDARIRLARGDAAGAEPLLRRILADSQSSPALRWTANAELGKLLAGKNRPRQAEAAFENAMALVEAGVAGLSAAEDRMAFLSGRMDVYRETLHFLLAQNRPNDALRVAERSRARTLRDGNLRRRVRAEAPVLFYWLDEPASHLWVADPAKGVAYFRLPGAKEIQELVATHNQFLLRARNPLTEGGQEGRKLYEMLVKPAAEHLRGRRVLLSPDGALHALNFETLIVPGPDHYWLEDVALSVVPGLTGFPNYARPHSRRMLLAGDPATRETGYAPLRHAGEEMNRIAKQFGVVPLRGEAATPRAVRDALEREPAYVHFAAHAEANRLRPLESAILLSPDGKSDKLYAREVAGIRMRAHLVTLSACSAAGAKAVRGEGLVGFAWAFLGAGAENVVASLWEVDDASTPRLMEQMYRQLEAGRAPGEALREAKLALLRSGTALEKPYFWGAFQHFQP